MIHNSLLRPTLVYQAFTSECSSWGVALQQHTRTFFAWLSHWQGISCVCEVVRRILGCRSGRTCCALPRLVAFTQSTEVSPQALGVD